MIDKIQKVKNAMGFLLSAAYPEMIASEHKRNNDVLAELCKLVDSLKQDCFVSSKKCWAEVPITIPPNEDGVYMCLPQKDAFTYHNGMWWHGAYRVDGITHWLEPYTPPVEDGKQGGEVGMSVEDVLADIILIRNKLHEDLPTGEMNAFELLQTIKWHINELDNYCTTLSTLKSQPSTPVQDGWVAIRDRLPDQAACIFAYKFGVAEGKYFMGRFLKTDLETVFPEVTHWQTLPSPPVNKQD